MAVEVVALRRSVMAAVVVYGGIVIQENKGEHMVKVKTVKKMNLKSYV